LCIDSIRLLVFKNMTQRKIFAKKEHKKESAENDAIELRNWLHSLNFMKLMKLGGAVGEGRDVHEKDKNAYKILV